MLLQLQMQSKEKILISKFPPHSAKKKKKSTVYMYVCVCLYIDIYIHFYLKHLRVSTEMK